VAIIAIGFATHADRADHLANHAEDFGAISEIEYENMAIAFLNSPLDSDTLEGVRRSNGDIIRFHRVTHVFAVMRQDGVIRTFYKPDPTWHGSVATLRTSKTSAGNEIPLPRLWL
jgi:pyocin large subunit-like protein